MSLWGLFLSLLLFNLIISGCYFHQTQHARWLFFFFMNVCYHNCLLHGLLGGERERYKKKINLLVGCNLWRNLRGTIRNRWGLERRPRAAEQRRADREGSWGVWVKLGSRTMPNWPRRTLCWVEPAQRVPYRSVPYWNDPISFLICPMLQQTTKKNTNLEIKFCQNFAWIKYNVKKTILG